MLISWNWLKEYVPFEMEPAELAQRLAMAGFNHEGTERVGGDLAIDLEVTSNRPDCLGHIGVAREVAVLWQRTCSSPSPARRRARRRPASCARCGSIARNSVAVIRRG